MPRLRRLASATSAAVATGPARPAVHALYRSLVGIARTFDGGGGGGDAGRALLSAAPGVPGLDAFLGHAALYTPGRSDQRSVLSAIRSAFRHKVWAGGRGRER